MAEPTYSPADLPPRIAARVRVDPETGCWIWTGAKRGNGQYGYYGDVGYEGRRFSTHRLVYSLLVRPPTEGDVFDHLCGRKLCCNPTHLESVTLAENARRSAAQRLKTHCPKGHPYTRTSYGVRQCEPCRREWERHRRRDPVVRERQREAERKWRQRNPDAKRARRPGPGQDPLFKE